MGDINNLHSNFLNKDPDIQISLSAFRVLRPQQCIPVGAKDTHNVCVCKIYGNIRLKLRGLKEEFVRKNFDFKTTYHDYLKDMICNNPSADCFFENCSDCSGTIKIMKDLKKPYKIRKFKKFLIINGSQLTGIYSFINLLTYYLFKFSKFELFFICQLITYSN